MSSSRIDALRKFLSELLGTFAMVFAGTGAIVINAESGGAITHLGVALTFGLVVLAMIYTLGDVSGAHLNPAVTLAFAVAGLFPYLSVLLYIAAQFSGALLASITLRFLFPQNTNLGATIPAGLPMQSFALEIILSAILMFVILNVSQGSKEKGITAGIVVGSVIALEALFAGPICGASMNPARSLGPAIVSEHLEHLWIYLAAPVLGMLVAIPLYRVVRNNAER
jgi:aquaporin NIP